MISLAILACAVLLFTLLCGPIVYFISKIEFIPKVVRNTLAIFCLLFSSYFLVTIPIPIMQLFCFISIIFSYASIEIKKPTRFN